MHPSIRLMMKGPRPKDQAILADPVPTSKFADTHTWVKGYWQGEDCNFVDDLLQAGHKASNI
eukprot:8789964-Prorocentrum_lima.AAC.1